jgi:hypothetical protein
VRDEVDPTVFAHLLLQGQGAVARDHLQMPLTARVAGKETMETRPLDIAVEEQERHLALPRVAPLIPPLDPVAVAAVDQDLHPVLQILGMPVGEDGRQVQNEDTEKSNGQTRPKRNRKQRLNVECRRCFLQQ